MYIIHVMYDVRTLYKVHCTMYSTLYRVYCTMYSVHFTEYIVQCTLYIVQSILYNVLCTLYNVPMPCHLAGVADQAILLLLLSLVALHNKRYLMAHINYNTVKNVCPL